MLLTFITSNDDDYDGDNGNDDDDYDYGNDDDDDDDDVYDDDDCVGGERPTPSRRQLYRYIAPFILQSTAEWGKKIEI